VNIVVLIEVADGAEVFLDSTSDRFRWNSIDPEIAESRGEDKYIVSVLRRMKAWKGTFHAHAF
jgi:hypothetical protein